jgi:hypothetical protein
MKANYTITFADGTEHTYTGAPAGLSQDDVYNRASKDFRGKSIQHMHREVEQLPVQATAAEDQSSAETRRLAGKAEEARRPKTTLGKIARSADDVVRGIADTVTLGFADELAAKANSLFKGTTYEAEREAERQRDDEGGASRVVGQVGGAFLPGTALAKGAQTLSKGQATTRAIGSGAVVGAGYGAGSSTAEDSSGIAADAALGALGGAVGAKAIDAASRGVKWIGGRSALKKLADPETVKMQASKLYEQADSLGVSIKPEALQSGISGIVNNLTKAGITPKSPVNSHKEVHAVVEYLKDAASGTQPLSWRDVENLRRAASDVARNSQDPTVKKFVGEVVDDWDDVIAGLQPKAFNNPGGSATTAEALRLTRDARESWKQVSKAQILEELGRKVEAGQLTGSRTDTKAIRTAITSLMKNKRQWAKFNTQEKQALADIAKASVTGKGMDVAEAVQFGSGRLSDLSNLGLAYATDGGSLVANLGIKGLTMARDKMTQSELDDLIKLVANNRVPNQFTGSTREAVGTGIGTGLLSGNLVAGD